MIIMVVFNSLLFLSYASFSFSASINGKVVINKLVTVGQPSQPYFEQSWGKSWPPGIRLLNSWQTSVGNSKSKKNSLDETYKPVSMAPPSRRTYTWKGDNLIITFNITETSNPVSSKLVPPIAWLTSSGTTVKVWRNGGVSYDYTISNSTTMPNFESSARRDEPSDRWNQFRRQKIRGLGNTEYYNGLDDSLLNSVKNKEPKNIIEIMVPKFKIEKATSCLHQQGFSNEDIYRMLDKGPWVLAFDIQKSVPKLVDDLKHDLKLVQSEVIHIISHCPYLVAQYCRYKGRDVHASALALLDIGMDPNKLKDNYIRFPSMLAAPPDRIRGWRALLNNYGIATEPLTFGKLLLKSSFMYYVNPPQIFDEDDSLRIHDDISVTASSFIAYESLRILQNLQSLGLTSKTLDKIIRSIPNILLENGNDISARVMYLHNLFLEHPSVTLANDTSTTTTPTPITSTTTTTTMTTIPSLPTNQNIVNNFLPLKSPTTTTTTTTTTPTIPSLSMKSNNFFNGIIADSSSSSSSSSSNDIRATNEDRDITIRVQELLNSVLYSYPTILKTNSQLMRSASNSLRASGLRRSDVVVLIRRYPLVLEKNPATIRAIMDFLKDRCGLRKMDIVPLLSRFPAVFGFTINELEAKISYLYESLGGTPEMLRQFPTYLSFNVESHVKPRAEFLRAIGVDPLFNGLVFLVTSTPEELSLSIGVKTETFSKFCALFVETRRKN